jgi:hypothetical protein
LVGNIKVRPACKEDEDKQRVSDEASDRLSSLAAGLMIEGLDTSGIKGT